MFTLPYAVTRVGNILRHGQRPGMVHAVIVDRDTWRQLPRRPMPQVHTIVVTTTPLNGMDDAPSNTLTAHAVLTLEAALQQCDVIPGVDRVFVLNSRQLLAEATGPCFVEGCDFLYVTRCSSSTEGEYVNEHVATASRVFGKPIIVETSTAPAGDGDVDVDSVAVTHAVFEAPGRVRCTAAQRHPVPYFNILYPVSSMPAGGLVLPGPSEAYGRVLRSLIDTGLADDVRGCVAQTTVLLMFETAIPPSEEAATATTPAAHDAEPLFHVLGGVVTGSVMVPHPVSTQELRVEMHRVAGRTRVYGASHGCHVARVVMNLVSGVYLRDGVDVGSAVEQLTRSYTLPL